MTMKPKDRKDTRSEENLSEGKVSGWGGYSTRHEYEKKRKQKNPWLQAGKVIAIVLLIGLSCVGVISLVRGDFLPEKETGGGNAGSIKVPTQSELSEIERSPDEMLAEVEISLVTFEIENADGSFRYGTGFVVSDDGYAVCASSLFSGEVPMKSPSNITAYTDGGFSSSVEIEGTQETLGITLLRLQSGFTYTPIPVENSSFVERGESLYAVSSHKAKLFYGTVAQGAVASVGPAVRVGDEGDGMNVNIIYLDILANESLHGAVVVDAKGAAVGFCTDALPPLYGNLTPVVPINTVYTVINDILLQG